MIRLHLLYFNEERSLVLLRSGKAFSLLSIEPKDGTLSVVKPILYKDIPFHSDQEGIITLTVKATDRGDVPNSASVPVLVRLEVGVMRNLICGNGRTNRYSLNL